ncbi:MAG: 1-acyl-sn-glycerol-3-phosphate acyltransferase, partial [Bacteroidales bacterium]|nr:1-acyl-sn-glycerol-3-phosphate acyltransferase [Bacteroidales bacterium]
PDQLKDAADFLADDLMEADGGQHISSLIHRIDSDRITRISDFVVSNLPYYLDKEDYDRIDTLLTRENISRQLAVDRTILSGPVGAVRDVILSDPMFFSSRILQGLSDFSIGNQYTTDDEYIFTADGKEAVVIVSSKHPVSETLENGLLIEQIDESCRKVASEFNVQATPFGASIISIGNSSQIKKDSLLCGIIAMLLIICVLIYYYRNFKSILMILVSILFGCLFALCIISIVRNPVSLIAVGVATIIFGISINYPIHFLSHLKRTANREEVISDIVNPLLTGNITTVGAFLSLLFINSGAMKDLGLFAAMMLAGTILFVLIFLPHFKISQVKSNTLAFSRIANYSPESGRWPVLLLAAATIALWLFSPKATFNPDMHSINYMTDDQRAMFAKLSEQQDTSVTRVYAVSGGPDMDEALANHERVLQFLSDNRDIAKISGLGAYIPSRKVQQSKLQYWNEFWSGRRDKFLTIFAEEAARNGYKEGVFHKFTELLTKDFEPQNYEHFAAGLENLVSPYIYEDGGEIMVYDFLDIKKVAVESVEAEIDNISPKNIFSFADVNFSERMANAISEDFDFVLYVCGLIVLVFLFLSFSSIEMTIASFLPLIIAWIWILSIMGIFGMSFNIVNVILATFIFGMGDDYSIFVTEGKMFEYRTGRKMLPQFKNSIILSSTIMFIAIGMLIFAKHPAMHSLAQVTIIGMFTVVVMAYVFPPAIFEVLVRKGGKPRMIPITLKGLAINVYVFTVFILSALIFSIYGFLLLTIGGKTPEHKLRFHKLLAKVFRFFAKAMPGVECYVENTSGEDFSRPSVIIANHQSHFDLLYTLMLHPKIIALTNDWVWNNPFYGWIIRYCEFLPTTGDMAENMPILKEKIAEGYSILVFPEGTRSQDCSILRFHQGAFHLADTFNLDILPIVIHGVGHVLPKQEFYLRKGRVDISIKQRVSPSEYKAMGESYRSIASAFRKEFIAWYSYLCDKVEDTAYYLDLVRHNYIYKGADVDRAARRRLKKCDLESLISTLPNEGRVNIKNCGQGELPLIMALVKKNLQFIAEDNDPSLLEIAAACISIPANLAYREPLTDETFDAVIDLNER